MVCSRTSPLNINTKVILQKVYIFSTDNFWHQDLPQLCIADSQTISRILKILHFYKNFCCEEISKISKAVSLTVILYSFLAKDSKFFNCKSSQLRWYAKCWSPLLHAVFLKTGGITTRGKRREKICTHKNTQRSVFCQPDNLITRVNADL